MKEYCVSVIVPIYNVPEVYLRKCIESIQNQTLRDIEILLIDDGSQNRCADICDEYANNDDRVKVIHKKNEGVACARNTGIYLSKSDYIMFVDGDDWISDNCVMKAYTEIRKGKYDLVGWNYYNCKNGRCVKNKAITPSIIEFSENDMHSLLLNFVTPEYGIRYFNRRLGPIRGVWGKIYSRKIIVENKLLFSVDLKIGEDACFNIDYCKCSGNILFFDEYLNYYRILSDSANRSFRRDIIVTRLSLLKAYLERFNDQKSTVEFGTCYLREVLSCVYNCLYKDISNLFSGESIRYKYAKLSELINSELICQAFNMEYDPVFFTVFEKIMIYLIRYKRKTLLYLFGILTFAKINIHR